MQRSLSSTCNTRAPVCSKYISARARNNITCSFTCGLRTVYLINLKNLICVDIVKCQVKFCILLDFLHIILFLTNLASTGGPHEISRRAACGTGVIASCSQSIYAIRVFKSHGLPAAEPHTVTRATTIAPLLYASPIRGGALPQKKIEL